MHTTHRFPIPAAESESSSESRTIRILGSRPLVMSRESHSWNWNVRHLNWLINSRMGTKGNLKGVKWLMELWASKQNSNEEWSRRSAVDQIQIAIKCFQIVCSGRVPHLIYHESGFFSVAIVSPMKTLRRRNGRTVEEAKEKQFLLRPI